MDEQLICCKCSREMEPAKTSLHYMGFHFNTELPRCPVCGQVYISEELVRGKMAEAEMHLEEK